MTDIFEAFRGHLAKGLDLPVLEGQVYKGFTRPCGALEMQDMRLSLLTRGLQETRLKVRIRIYPVTDPGGIPTRVEMVRSASAVLGLLAEGGFRAGDRFVRYEEGITASVLPKEGCVDCGVELVSTGAPADTVTYPIAAFAKVGTECVIPVQAG